MDHLQHTDPEKKEKGQKRHVSLCPTAVHMFLSAGLSMLNTVSWVSADYKGQRRYSNITSWQSAYVISIVTLEMGIYHPR